MRGKSNETLELNKNHQNRLSCVGLTARLIGKTSSLKAERLSLALFSIRLRSVPARPRALGLQTAQAVLMVFVPNPFLPRISQLRFAHSVTIV